MKIIIKTLPHCIARCQKNTHKCFATISNSSFFLTFPCTWTISSFSLNGAGIFKQFMSARNWVGIGLSYRPARLHNLAELVPWNRFLGSLKVQKFWLGNILTAPQTRGLQRRAACPLSAWPTLRDGVLPPSQLRECLRRGPHGGSLRSHPATSELRQVWVRKMQALAWQQN
jgi:hypothetical protein